MAKGKGSASVPNRPVYSRISFLYQAASYLSTTLEQSENPEGSNSADTLPPGDDAVRQNMSRRFLADMRATSHKSLIRLSPAVKQTVCKFCDTLLIEGQTSSSSVENASKGGKKPWADVLVITCKTCGGAKRFPVQASRQKRRPFRGAKTTSGDESTKASEPSQQPADAEMAAAG